MVLESDRFVWMVEVWKSGCTVLCVVVIITRLPWQRCVQTDEGHEHVVYGVHDDDVVVDTHNRTDHDHRPTNT